MALGNHFEKISVNKKKVTIYLSVAIATSLIVLMILTVINMFNKKTSIPEDEEHVIENNIEETSTDYPVNNLRNDFDKLISNSKYYDKQDTDKDIKHVDDRNISSDEITNPYQLQLNKRIQLEQAKENKRDPVSEYKEQEKLRGVMSNRSKWVNNQIMSKKNNGSDKKDNMIKDATDSMKSMSLDEKRKLNRAKIEETQNKLKQLEYYKDTGQINKLEKITTDIQESKKTFKTPPVDIVGYTKENIYDADTEGKYKIPVGTVIPALTTMKTISDYQGTFKALIDHDIYDSSDRFILLPKGTEFLIKSVKVSNVNEIIENRMGYTVTWAILPNGKKIDFSKSSGLDREGIGAIKDKVNYHFLSQFFGVAAYALISEQSSRGSTSYNDQSTFAGDLGEGLRSQTKPLAQKYMNVVPTRTISTGIPIRIIIEDEIFIDMWRDLYEQYY